MVTNFEMTYWVYKDRSGYWRWQLVHRNGNIISDSAEGYVNKGDCIHGLNLNASSGGCAIKER